MPKFVLIKHLILMEKSVLVVKNQNNFSIIKRMNVKGAMKASSIKMENVKTKLQ